MPSLRPLTLLTALLASSSTLLVTAAPNPFLHSAAALKAIKARAPSPLPRPNGTPISQVSSFNATDADSGNSDNGGTGTNDGAGVSTIYENGAYLPEPAAIVLWDALQIVLGFLEVVNDTSSSDNSNPDSTSTSTTTSSTEDDSSFSDDLDPAGGVSTSPSASLSTPVSNSSSPSPLGTPVEIPPFPNITPVPYPSSSELSSSSSTNDTDGSAGSNLTSVFIPSSVVEALMDLVALSGPYISEYVNAESRPGPHLLEPAGASGLNWTGPGQGPRVLSTNDNMQEDTEQKRKRGEGTRPKERNWF
ncbi:MAG: hypothetical protein M1827_000938 [Pycnora praestabilis]|nr:MAG: hypothetical protein M1827_000938 [Pycnora praestabilis]